MLHRIMRLFGIGRPRALDGQPIPPKRLKLLRQLEDRLGVRFRNLSLLNQALIHRSYLNGKRANRIESNERMEFLGDSVLGLVVNDHLYKSRPTENEGNLTKIKSLIVSRQILAQKAEEMGLGKYLLLSSGEIESGGRNRTSIIADALEGVIGAIYLDRGFEDCQKLIGRIILDEVLEITQNEENINYKSLLQEKVQSERKVHPVYRIRREAGPDHDKTFHVEVAVSGRIWGRGDGNTKKEAEQAAARSALDRAKQRGDGRPKQGQRRSRRRPRRTQNQGPRPEKS